MKQKELTKTFMMISNGKKLWSLGLCKQYLSVIAIVDYRCAGLMP